MARQKGSMSVSANFEVKAAAALDSRYIVPTVADLTDSTTWVTGGLAYIYKGMQVFVTSVQKLYILMDNDYSVSSNWKEIAQSGDVTSDGVYKTSDTITFAIDSTTTLDIANITGIDLDKVVLKETLIYDNNGTIGVVISIDKTNSEITVKTITNTGMKSDGIYTTTDTMSKTIGNSTTLDASNISGLVLGSIVLGQTLISDGNGTIGKVTSIDTANNEVSVITLTISEYSDGIYKTTDTINATIDSTTILNVTHISGLVLDNIVLNETIIYDIAGTIAKVTTIDNVNNEITVVTISSTGMKSDGTYSTIRTLSTTIGNTTVLDINDTSISNINNVVINETIIYDTDGTVGIVTAVDTVNSEVTVTTITKAGGNGNGSLSAVLRSSQNVGGVKAGDSFAEGTDFEELFRAILDPVLYPTLTNPSASLTATGSKIIEDGGSLNTTFTCTFNRGAINPAYGTSGYRAGAATDYSLNGGTAQSGNTWNATIDQTTASTYSAVVNYSAGEQPKDSAGRNYSTPLAAGSVTTNQIKYEFVNGMWANTSDITTIAKLTLVSKSTGTYTFVFPAQSVSYPECFDIPADWTVTSIKALNELSGTYDDVSAEFTESTYTHNNAAGDVVNYKRYTDNRGYSAGSRKVKITWS